MRILLVDDNEITNFFHQDLLEDMGIFSHIDIIDSGTDAINLMEKVKAGDYPLPELIFMDVKIPDYDGFEVLDEFEEMEIEGIKDTLVCMLTTSEHKRDHESFDKSPLASVYMQKPLTEDAVKALLREHRPEVLK